LADIVFNTSTTSASSRRVGRPMPTVYFAASGYGSCGSSALGLLLPSSVLGSDRYLVARNLSESTTTCLGESSFDGHVVLDGGSYVSVPGINLRGLNFTFSVWLRLDLTDKFARPVVSFNVTSGPVVSMTHLNGSVSWGVAGSAPAWSPVSDWNLFVGKCFFDSSFSEVFF